MAQNRDRSYGYVLVTSGVSGRKPDQQFNTTRAYGTRRRGLSGEPCYCRTEIVYLRGSIIMVAGLQLAYGELGTTLVVLGETSQQAGKEVFNAKKLMLASGA